MRRCSRYSALRFFVAPVGCPTPLGELSCIYVVQVCTGAPQSKATLLALSRISIFKALVGCPTPLGELSRIYVVQVFIAARQSKAALLALSRIANFWRTGGMPNPVGRTLAYLCHTGMYYCAATNTDA